MHKSNRCAVMLALVVAAACGKPMDPSGKEATFTKASMGGTAPTGPDRPLAADLAVFAVEKLVTDNRIKTADALQARLNKKPGEFSHLDLDKDAKPDPLSVVKVDIPGTNSFEIRVRPATGEFVVATMRFTPDWEFEGHYDGTTKFASTVGRPLPAAPTTAAAPPAPPAAPASVPNVAGAVDPNAPAAGAGGAAPIGTAPSPTPTPAPTPAPTSAPVPATTPTPAPAPSAAPAGAAEAVPTGALADTKTPAP